MPSLPALAAALALFALPGPGRAETATIAVASNFAPTAEALAADYGAASGDQITIASGATAKLATQIAAGAPFDAFLSADQATPERLGADGFALPETRFTYAVGTLVLWSAEAATDLADPKAALKAARHVAVANPDLAPYGKSAMQTIDKLGLSEDLVGRIVTAENIGQVQGLVASGAADMGFVAGAALAGKPGGARWQVPAALHDPLTQDAILLAHGAGNMAAKGFLAYLRAPAARARIAAAGYGVGP